MPCDQQARRSLYNRSHATHAETDLPFDCFPADCAGCFHIVPGGQEFCQAGVSGGEYVSGERGMLPIFFVVTNDGSQPVSIANMEVTLITANNSKLTPISPEDIYRRLSNPQANTNPTPLPFPVPHKKVKGTVSKKEMDEIESSQFAAKAVEPRTTQSGFLFLDVGGITDPLTGAHIDITGVADAKGVELMYFEISMDKYLDGAGKP